SVYLTELARKGKLDPTIGRDEEIRRTIQILSRRTKSNPVLIGPPGVGKTAILEGLASRIVAKEVPESLQNKRVLSIDLSAIMAGSGIRGQFEEKFKALIRDIEEEAGNVICFIDEVHTLFNLGKAEGSIDAGQMIKPALARGLQLVGATTPDEYRKTIGKDAALERRFQPVQISEPSVESTISILRGLKPRYEVHHGVEIFDSALVTAAVYSARYVSDRDLPDKAIDLVDEAASALRDVNWKDGFLFNDEQRGLININMSEYHDRHTISRLVEAAPGYVGFEGGQLTEAVGRNPYAVILLDELEKAHKASSSITNSQGRKVDFKNTIICLIEVLQRTSEYFPPELLNRLDTMLVFNKLSRESILQVVSLRAERLRNKRISFDVDEKAREWLANHGYSEMYGARAIARMVSKLVHMVDSLRQRVLGENSTISGSGEETNAAKPLRERPI
ncbi:hypothetical protein MPER_11665, partial [Moniliophthora perniciosa FA553]